MSVTLGTSERCVCGARLEYMVDAIGRLRPYCPKKARCPGVAPAPPPMPTFAADAPVSERLRALMAWRGVDADTVATRAAVDRTTIVNILEGRRGGSPATREAIARALDVPVATFVLAPTVAEVARVAAAAPASAGDAPAWTPSIRARAAGADAATAAADEATDDATDDATGDLAAAAAAWPDGAPPAPADASFGDRVRALARWRGLPLAQVADEAGLFRDALYECCKGRRAVTVQTRARVARALGVPDAALGPTTSRRESPRRPPARDARDAARAACTPADLAALAALLPPPAELARMRQIVRAADLLARWQAGRAVDASSPTPAPEARAA